MSCVTRTGLAAATFLCIAASSCGPAARPSPSVPTAEEAILAKLQRDPEFASTFRGHRLAVLRSSSGATGKESDGPLLTNVVTLDYTTGTAAQIAIEPTSGRIVNQRKTRGRPAASPHEIDEAAGIASADARIQPLLRQGYELEGGIAISGPLDQPTTSAPHRYMQFMLLAPGRTAVAKNMIVDLTDGRIALLQEPPEVPVP
jgi:hypothetical protein